MLPVAPSLSSTSSPSRPQTLSFHREGRVERAELARQVLLHLYNTSADTAPPSFARDSADGAMALLHGRIVTNHNFRNAPRDLGILVATLNNAVAWGDADPGQRLGNVSLGKALQVICELLRRQATLPLDGHSLVSAAQTCCMLVERQTQFRLENCGVIMFHLGKLIGYTAMTARCKALICDHLAPIFRAQMLRGDAHAFTGPDVVFGLVSALRASELAIDVKRNEIPARTAGDALLGAMQDVLSRNPGLLTRCHSATLGLLARQGVHYLLRLAAVRVPADAVDALKLRQFAVAQLIKRCIDEVRDPVPRAADANGGPPPRGAGGHLEFAPAYYNRWLNQQASHVQSLLGLSEPPPAGQGVVTQPAMLPPATRFHQTLAALSPPPGAQPQEAVRHQHQRDLDSAFDEARALIHEADARESVPGLDERARMLLDLDALYQQLALANPLGSARYDAQLTILGDYLQHAVTQLRDVQGAPLLGPPLASAGGLHSWQRLLLSGLLS